MRLTIIPSDKSVYKDYFCINKLSLEGIPENVHALQWLDDRGWIEFNDSSQNQEITELPLWAIEAEKMWDDSYKILSKS